jgi:hypothetical protein
LYLKGPDWVQFARSGGVIFQHHIPPFLLANMSLLTTGCQHCCAKRVHAPFNAPL